MLITCRSVGWPGEQNNFSDNEIAPQRVHYLPSVRPAARALVAAARKHLSRGALCRAARRSALAVMDLNTMMASVASEVNLMPAKLRSRIVSGSAAGRVPATRWLDADRDETLCVRSEYLHLDTSAAGSSLGIQKRVLGLTFVEDAMIVKSGGDSGLQLLSKVLNISAEPMPDMGEICLASRLQTMQGF